MGARVFPARLRRRIGLTLIIDSVARIEFLTGGVHGPTVRRRFESGDLLITPELVLAEVARKYGRDGQSGDLTHGHVRGMVALSDIQPLTTEIAMGIVTAVSELRAHARRHKLDPPSSADSVILATARVRRGKVLTADRHFSDIADVDWMGESALRREPLESR